MRLKLYRAPNVSSAMEQLRAELGPDALILATRRVADGVELTAAFAPPAPGPVPPLPDPAREAALVWHGVPAPLAAELAAGPLDAALGAALRFAPLPLEGDGKPLLLVGPPGAGKTLAVARLATRLVLAGAPPLVVTADGKRAGATEQLAAFTRLLGLTLIAAGHPIALARALPRRPPGAAVLIDAPGTDPFDPAQREELAALAAVAQAEPVLVLPGGLDSAEAADLGGAFAELGTALMLPTRLDQARRLGGVLAAARAGDLALTEAGIGPGAADGLEPLTPGGLARRLLARPDEARRITTLDAA